jgi:hyperosmotically inducible protein
MKHRTFAALGAIALTAATATAMALLGYGKTPQAPIPSASAEAVNVSDTDVTEHVKTALQQNDALKGFDIEVVTTKGDVRLAGVVNLPSQMYEAIRIARASEGAHTIHNEITLK